MKTPDREYFMRTKTQVEKLLNHIVGFQTEVYWGDSEFTGSGRGDSYQIMPLRSQDAGDFWRWHLANNRQWFESPSMPRFLL